MRSYNANATCLVHVRGTRLISENHEHLYPQNLPAIWYSHAFIVVVNAMSH